ncbi:MAG TPA: phage portal protein [Gallionellaceae bacterium]|jgi:hypothetical protein|nr:phage portal protein [Gallionellaceae bacterium]
MSDIARKVAFDPNAPQGERTDALAELQQSAMPTSVLSMETIGQIMEFADMNKSISQNIVPFPGKNQGKPGVQSVKLDDRQLGMHGEYWEKPASMSFDALRGMVDQTPVLNAVIMTRIRQVQRFCRVQEGGTGLGFAVKHIDKDHQISQSEQESIKMLNRFFSNCGWEFNPRARKKLRRDSFSGMMGKAVRDSLVMDSCAIETEMKRDRSRGIDGLAVVDGATIRLTPEGGYKGDDDIFALQLVMGAVKTAYTYDDLIYEPRNPRSDIIVGGYGLGETELLVRVVTGFLNAMTHNITGFDKNAIPKGVLHLSGDYTQEDLVAFRRYWNSMVKGVNSQWSVPVLVSKDQESKASFEKFGVDYDEMHFSKWMTFLSSLICAIYGMSPSEINFDSFSGGNSSPLNGSDTAEKLADSKDKGLRPLLSYFENLFTDYITCDFSDKYVFRWAGLDEEDAKVKEERAGKILTVNEMRAEEGYDKMDGPLGDAPLNPSLVGPWQALMQQEQPKDFGGQAQPGGEGEQGKDVPEGFGGKDNGEDFGQQGGNDAGRNDDKQGGGDDQQGKAPEQAADGDAGESDDEKQKKPLAKSFPVVDEPLDFGTRETVIYRLGDL